VATVAIVGLTGPGAATALMLAASGVGTVRCVDPLPVSAADVYLSPFLDLDSVGAPRASTVARVLAGSSPQVRAPAMNGTLQSEEDVRNAIAGADFVVCCLDAGQSNLIYKLNRVCLATNTRWLACALSGAEIVVGPGIHPGRTACYMCYRMRAVACAGNPEQAFAYERYLDRHKQDDSGRRENVVFSASIAAGFLGTEVLKELTGVAEPSFTGRLLTVRDRHGHRASCGSAQAVVPIAFPRRHAMPVNSLQDLVSPKVGIIKELAPQARGGDEPLPPFLYTAQLSHFDFHVTEKSERIGAGKGRTKQEAIAAAIGEAVERYCAFQWDPSRTFIAARKDLKGPSIAPSELVLYSEAQYKQSDRGVVNWQESNETTWMQGVELPSGEPVAVPASLVYLVTPPPRPEDFFTPASSNGLAAGPTLDHAVLGGLCELMERDALLIAWMNRLPAIELDLRASGRAARALARHYASFSVDIRAFMLPTDLPASIVMALSLESDPNRPAQVVGMGCHVDPEVAWSRRYTRCVRGVRAERNGSRKPSSRPSPRA
jgi:ribosomal protein S12 methylthiotransferase accessory factor